MKKRLTMALAAGALVAAMAPGVVAAGHGGKHVVVPTPATASCISYDLAAAPDANAAPAYGHWAWISIEGGCE